ncbi:hypothetical protein IEE82_10760 [Acinetobacter baumannii]|nr:hypothetical protein IEE82_10760 [Acinetobacter baumannii]
MLKAYQLMSFCFNPTRFGRFASLLAERITAHEALPNTSYWRGFYFWRAAMYMPEMDLTKHIQLKEVLRQEALKAMDQMIEMQQLESAGNDFKPFTQRNDIKPATTKTMKNRQKRLRKKK